MKKNVIILFCIISILSILASNIKSFGLIDIVKAQGIKTYGLPWVSGFFESPSDISFNGEYVYVSDSNNSQIHVYDVGLKPLFWFGGYGSRDANFIEINGIYSTTDSVYISSIDSHSLKSGRIQAFTNDGIYKNTFENPKIRSDFLKITYLSNKTIIAITEDTLCVYSNTGKLIKESKIILDSVFISLEDIVTIPGYGFAFVDRNKRGFFVIDNNLKEIRSYGEEYIYLPVAIGFGKNQFFIVNSNGNINVFSRNGSFISTISTNLYINSIDLLDNKTLIGTSPLKNEIIKINIDTKDVQSLKFEPKFELELHWPGVINIDENNLISVNDDYGYGIKIFSSENSQFKGYSGKDNDETLKVVSIASIRQDKIYLLAKNDLSNIYVYEKNKFKKKMNVSDDSIFSIIRIDGENNNLYSLDKNKNSILIFSRDDELIKTLNFDPIKEKICSLFINDNLYLSTSNGSIISLDLSNWERKSITELKDITNKSLDLNHFAVTNNYFFISNRFEHSICTFSREDGSLINSYGGIGGPKTFESISNIQVDINYEEGKFLFPEEIFYKEGIIYVTDSGNHRIQAIPEEFLLKKETTIILKIGSKLAYINNKETTLDVSPFIYNSRTMVPIRFISESFGSSVNWNNNDRSITIIDNEYTIVMRINKREVLVNKENKIIDTPPIIQNNRSFIPIRYIAEFLKSDVNWNDRKQTVTIRRYR